MTHEEFQSLETYKAERRRGIVHTPEWEAYMFRLQGEWEMEMCSNPLGPRSWDRRRTLWMRILGRRLPPETEISEDLGRAICFLRLNRALMSKYERTLLREIESRIHGGLPIETKQEGALTELARRIKSEMMKDKDILTRE